MLINLSDGGMIRVLPKAGNQVEVQIMDRDADEVMITLTVAEAEWLSLTVLTANGTITTGEARTHCEDCGRRLGHKSCRCGIEP